MKWRKCKSILYILAGFNNEVHFQRALCHVDIGLMLNISLLSLTVAELCSAVYIHKCIEMCESVMFESGKHNFTFSATNALHAWTHLFCFLHTKSRQSCSFFYFLLMIFVNFKLTIYWQYILSSGNSHLLTAIRSIWSKVPWKDFQAWTCSLLSVNILFQWPSLSCHIFQSCTRWPSRLKGKFI